MNHFGGGPELTGFEGRFETLFKTRLNDRDFTTVDALYVLLFDINTSYIDTTVGQYNRGG
ncbi:hypothetical protein KaCgl_21130 [Corynebacterium glutamicum]|nr:hypothetical protein KaCgl_21130 [Corynebacterium glutamicum]